MNSSRALSVSYVTHLSHCCVPCRLPGVTACSPCQPAWGTTGPGWCAGLCPSAHPWLRDPGAWQQRKGAPEHVTELHQGRKKCFVPYWRPKCIRKRNESLKVWPRQIPPVWRERPIFLISHFWQGVQPECRTQGTISSIKQWGVCQDSSVHTGQCGILPVTLTTKQQQGVVQCCWPWLPSATKTQEAF